MTRAFLDHWTVITFMTIYAIYSLYLDDVRLIAFPKENDQIFSAVTFAGIIFFTLEILLASYSIDGFPGSFFFWIDIFSTITMIPDVDWIWNLVLAEGT